MNSSCVPDPVAVAVEAMATRFEIVLHGPNPVALRAAGEEALAEIERLEARLSLYRPDSEIARVNALAAREPVRVTPEVFALLMVARQIHEETGGVFDITIAPLMRCWGFLGDSGRMPSPEAVAAARQRVGMSRVELDPGTCSVRFAREGVMLDLGAIGKGYAIEQAAGLLREAGITSALLHGGTSTVCALGCPPDAEAWKVVVDRPATQGDADSKVPLATVNLCDEALSVSAVWGKSFQAGGRTYGHVLDPRTGEPSNSAVLAAVVAPSGTESDAFSTALLTMGFAGIGKLASVRTGLRTLVVAREEAGLEIGGDGIAPQPSPADTRVIHRVDGGSGMQHPGTEGTHNLQTPQAVHCPYEGE